MRHMLRYVISCFVFFGICGCGSKIIVTPVDKKDIQPVMQEPGIYYTLPKTVIDATIPFMATSFIKGKYADNFEECVDFCSGKSKKECKPNQEDNGEDIFIKEIVFAPRMEPDYSHSYRLEADLKWYSKFSHNVKLTPGGVFASSKSTVGNPTAEIATEAIRIVGSAVLMFAKKKDATGDEKGVCEDIRNITATLSDYNKIIEKNKQTVQIIKSQKENMLLNKGLKSELAVLEKVLEYYDETIKEKEKQLEKEMWASMSEKRKDDIKKALAKIQVIKSEPRNFILSRTIDPKEFTPFNDNDVNKWTLHEVKVTKIGNEKITQLDEIKKDSEDFKSLVGGPSYELKIQPTLPFAAKKTDDTSYEKFENDSRNMRYRLPALSEVELIGCKKINQNEVCRKDILATTKITVAQYGSIAYLPSDFKGSEQTIQLEIYPETGGIKEVAIGATPLSTASMKEATTVLTDSSKDYKDRDLSELERKKKKLEYEKNILEYKAQISEIEAKQKK